MPESWKADFEQKGVAPTLPTCKRRYPRMRCRSRNALVPLELRQSLPAFPRVPGWCAVYLTDVGRGGIGMLHGEQLYPKEQFRIVLSEGTLGLIEIVRCERIDAHCFNIGARFLDK
ncbi:MAG TPA: hypothetical protein VFE24_10275 [Pirellulales bacterium]|nr:hypothetical protein [Pirellulales bacterium]